MSMMLVALALRPWVQLMRCNGTVPRILADDILLLSIGQGCDEELIEATNPDEVKWESADLLYFTMVTMAKAGVPLSETVAHLNHRQRKVTRRKGAAKAPFIKEDPKK